MGLFTRKQRFVLLNDLPEGPGVKLLLSLQRKRGRDYRGMNLSATDRCILWLADHASALEKRVCELESRLSKEAERETKQ